MTRIREDLTGSIMTGGHVLWAGDEVPVGVSVAVRHLAPEPAPAAPSPPTEAKPRKRGRPRKAVPDEPVGED